jgi:Secretion system C-terminal sorting domain
MGKLLIVIAVVFFAFPGFVFSQTFSNPPCTIAPASADTGLVTPNSFDSLQCIDKGLPYSSSVQLYMPLTFNGVIALDSLVITSITGMPAGITYAQNPASGVYYADSTGCIAFAGTTNADSGAYPLTFNGYAVVTTQNSGTQTLSFAQLRQLQDNPVPVYQLNVINQGDTCAPPAVVSGINSINSSLTSAMSVYPNPGNGNFEFRLYAGKSIDGELCVLDLTGKKIFSQKFETPGVYSTSFDISRFAKGLYTLQLKTEEGFASKLISVQ